MIISKFDINPCPKTTQIIRQLIRTRKLKQIMNKTEKPSILPVHQQIQQPEPRPREFTIEKQIGIKKQIKKKICKRNSFRKTVKQFKLMAKYNIFLLHYLNKTAKLEQSRNSPILTSVLDTRNEPDYPFDYEEENFKKQYPHYSNIIQLTKIPPEQKAPVFILPKKMNTSFKDIYATTCVTISQIKRFCARYLQSNQITFQKAAEKLIMPVRNVKLMYEVVDHVFQLEKMEQKILNFRNEAILRQKYIRLMKQAINKAFKDKQCSNFIPRNQLRVSLSQLHQRLNAMEIDIINQKQ